MTSEEAELWRAGELFGEDWTEQLAAKESLEESEVEDASAAGAESVGLGLSSAAADAADGSSGGWPGGRVPELARGAVADVTDAGRAEERSPRGGADRVGSPTAGRL